MKHKTWAEVVQARGQLDTVRLAVVGQVDSQGARVKQDNVVHKVFMVAASFLSGLLTSQRGPSILDLGDITHSSLQSTAWLFSLGALGHLLGCLGAGLVLGRLHGSIFLFWVLVAVSGTTVALPWCQQYGAMATVYCISFACIGCVETGCYAEIARRWGARGGSIVQLLQLFFVVGGVLSPGVTLSFLAPRNVHYLTHHNTSTHNETTPLSYNLDTSHISRNDQAFAATFSNLSSLNQSQADMESEDVSTDVKTAYVISGVISFLVAIPFLLSFLSRKKQPEVPPWKKDNKVPEYHDHVRDTRLSVLLLVGIFFFMVSAVEESLQQFLFTYMVHEAHWSAHMAAWLTSWFWCGMLLVRVSAYLLPDNVEDEVILTLSCAIVPCTLAGLYASVVFWNNNGAWACVFFAGMSVSLVFPVSFTWLLSNLAQKSSAVSAVVMFSTFLSEVVNPPILGSFFQSGHSSGFCFLLIGEAVVGLVVFLVLHALSKQLRAQWHSVSTRKSIHITKDLEVMEDNNGDIQ